MKRFENLLRVLIDLRIACLNQVAVVVDVLGTLRSWHSQNCSEDNENYGKSEKDYLSQGHTDAMHGEFRTAGTNDTDCGKSDSNSTKDHDGFELDL